MIIDYIANSFNLFQIDGWENRSVQSDWKKDEGTAREWVHTTGKWHGDLEDKGV